MASSHLNASYAPSHGSPVQRRTASLCFGIHVGLPIDEKLQQQKCEIVFSSTKKAPPHLYTLHMSLARRIMQRGPFKAISLFHICVGLQQQFCTLNKSSLRCPPQSSPSIPSTPSISTPLSINCFTNATSFFPAAPIKALAIFFSRAPLMTTTIFN